MRGKGMDGKVQRREGQKGREEGKGREGKGEEKRWKKNAENAIVFQMFNFGSSCTYPPSRSWPNWHVHVHHGHANGRHLKKSLYLSNCLTNRPDVWQIDVYWPSELHHQLNIILSPVKNLPPAMWPFVFYPACIWHTHWKWPLWNFSKVFSIRKLRVCSYHVALFAWWYMF